MPLLNKSSFEILLNFKSQVVRSKPYVHDCLSKQPRLRTRLVGTAGSFLKDSDWTPDGIGCDEVITPEPCGRNNCTMVLARLWYRTGRGSSQWPARGRYQSIAELRQERLIHLPRNSGIYPIVGFTVRA